MNILFCVIVAYLNKIPKIFYVINNIITHRECQQFKVGLRFSFEKNKNFYPSGRSILEMTYCKLNNLLFTILIRQMSNSLHV